MELRQQLAFLRSALPLVVVTTLLAAAAALGVSLILPATYEAQVVLLVGQSAPAGTASDLNDLQISERLSQTYAKLAVTRQVANDVIARLDLDTTYEELLKHVRSEATADSTLLAITVDDTDSARAAAIANAFATTMIEAPVARTDEFQEIQVQVEAEMTAVRDQITAIQERIDAIEADDAPSQIELAQLNAYEGQVATLRATFATLLSLTAGAPANQLAIADPALAPPTPTSPRVPINTALGGVIGLVLGVAVAYTRRRLDDTLRTPEDLESVTGLPVLGAIVRMPGDQRRPAYYRLATLLYPRSPAAEGFRHIRTGVEFASSESPVRTLLLTSAMPSDGKTVFATNLAVAFAQSGRTVVLVDADLRKPAVHEVFRVPNEHGLSDLLQDQQLRVSSVAQLTDVEGLRVIASGRLPVNPAEVVSSVRMRDVVREMHETADIVVLDSPPLQAVTDAAVLASIADGTILVAAAGRTRRTALVRARDTLQRVGARVLGTALNGVDERSGEEAAVGYFSYYGRPEPPSDSAPPPTRPTDVPPPPAQEPKRRRTRRGMGSGIRVEPTGSTDA